MLAHLIPALLIQLIVTMCLRSFAAGGASASVWAISREIAQAEYRWIEHLGGGLRSNMPWWGGVDYRVWMNVDPWLDWIVPSLVAIALAIVSRRLAGKRSNAKRHLLN